MLTPLPLFNSMSRLTFSARLVVLLLGFAAPFLGICAEKPDADKKVKGDGVIDRVVVAGSEPVFRADGYRFRIASATQVRFGNGLRSLSEVQTNTFASFEGIPDASGTIVATKAAFARLKLPSSKPDPKAVQVVTFPKGSKIDADNGFAVGPSAFPQADHGGWCGWYDIHEDAAEQERIRRLANKLVPQYQRDLPAEDPAKMPFRFYEVEEKEFRSPIFCGNGLVLIPTEVVHRLENDDQLAAVLADGIAGALQLQIATARGFSWKGVVGVDPAEPGLGGLVTTGIQGGATGVIVRHEMNKIEERQRGRMALALLADAGFKQQEALEAWVLLKPSHLSKDHSQLDYPERSLYLKRILEMEYKTAPTAQ
jgi:hypothetical protein